MCMRHHSPSHARTFRRLLDRVPSQEEAKPALRENVENASFLANCINQL
jgi:hypothetical protein